MWAEGRPQPCGLHREDASAAPPPLVIPSRCDRSSGSCFGSRSKRWRGHQDWLRVFALKGESSRSSRSGAKGNVGQPDQLHARLDLCGSTLQFRIVCLACEASIYQLFYT